MQNDFRLSTTKPRDQYRPRLLHNDAVAGCSSYSPFSVQQQQQQQHLQQQLQDMINRHALCLTLLREYAAEVESLRRENIALRSINRQLYNSIPSPSSSFNYVDQQTAPSYNLAEGEQEEEKESPTSVMDRAAMKSGGSSDDVVSEERVSLPKSISVRSNGYLTMISNNKTRSVTRIPAQTSPATASPLTGAQKVYVRGGKKEEPLELMVYNQGMIKTELCNKWQETGACPYGDQCQFAHGFQELRPVIRHPRYKTEVCRMVLTGDSCPYGHRCHFRHALTEQDRFKGGDNLNTGRRD